MHRLLTCSCLLVSILFSCQSGADPSPEDALSAEIQAIESSLSASLQIKGEEVKSYTIEERLAEYKIPGISVAVVRNGKLHWAKGYGLANTETGQMVDTSTLFQAASISKPVSGMGALKLVQEGKLALNQDINQYLTSWKLPENSFTNTVKVNLRHLLTHTGGTTVHGFPGYAQTDTFPTDIEVLKGQGNTAPIYVDTLPGAINRYSGGGYTIVERAVEDISGQSFADYMQAAVLSPLGMKHSTFIQPLPKAFHAQASAAFDRTGEMYPGLWHNYPEQAAAGLWTTPSDLARFAIGIQEAFVGKSEKVLSQDITEVMLTKDKWSYGLGPGLRAEGDSLIFQHGGKNAGYTCQLFSYAKRGDAMVVMSGSDNAARLIEEIQRAAAELYGWDLAQAETIELIDLPLAEMQDKVGRYIYRPQEFEVDIAIENDQLVIIVSPDEKYPLRFLDELNVIEFIDGDRFKFMLDEDGKVTGFMQGGRYQFDRLE